jgi:hypothetical protein
MFVNVIRDFPGQVVARRISSVKCCPNATRRAIDGIYHQGQYAPGMPVLQLLWSLDTIAAEYSVIDFETGTTANHQISQSEYFVWRLPAGKAIKGISPENQHQTLFAKATNLEQAIDTVGWPVALQLKRIQSEFRSLSNSQLNHFTAMRCTGLRLITMHRQCTGHELQLLQLEP